MIFSHKTLKTKSESRVLMFLPKGDCKRKHEATELSVDSVGLIIQGLFVNFSGANGRSLPQKYTFYFVPSSTPIRGFISHLFAKICSAAFINIFPLPKPKGKTNS